MKCCICSITINEQQSRVWLIEGVAHRRCRDEREQKKNMKIVEPPNGD